MDGTVARLLVRLHEETIEMRHHQQAFFAGDRSALQLAKKYERAVDKTLTEIDAAKFPPPPPAQSSLF